MRYACIAVLLISLGMMSCRSKPASPPVSAKDTAGFYPLHQYFEEQIRYVDLRDFSILSVRTADKQKDSGQITKEAFAALARPFLQKDITQPAVKAGYRETVFQDLSTGSITLHYQPQDNPAAEIQSIDILLDPDTRFVKRVLIRSGFTSGDTLVTEHSSWKTDKSFQITRSYLLKNAPVKETSITVSWKKKESGNDQ
jgi:hypothetical protein